MAGTAYHIGAYKQIAATSNCAARSCHLIGMFISSASNTPTITVYDDSGSGTATKLVDTFTPVSSTWYPMPFEAINGVNVVITGTISCTVGTS